MSALSLRGKSGSAPAGPAPYTPGSENVARPEDALLRDFESVRRNWQDYVASQADPIVCVTAGGDGWEVYWGHVLLSRAREMNFSAFPSIRVRDADGRVLNEPGKAP